MVECSSSPLSTVEDRYALFLAILNSPAQQCIAKIEAEEWHIDSTLNNFQWTLLHCASFVGSSPLVEYLLDKGADHTVTTGQGLDAQMLAEQNGHLSLAQYISTH